MANEIRTLLALNTTDWFFMVLNPDNRGQAWDTNAAGWATYDPTDANQQISFSSTIAAGTYDEWHLADLPAGLAAGSSYLFDVYDDQGDYRQGGSTENIASHGDIDELAVSSADIDQYEVPPSRTAIIKVTSDNALKSEETLEISVGESNVLYAFDFRQDLSGERIGSVTSVTVYESNGTESSKVTVNNTYWRQGPKAKAKLSGVTAGTGLYIEVVVVYTNSTGTRKATIPLACIA